MWRATRRAFLGTVAAASAGCTRPAGPDPLATLAVPDLARGASFGWDVALDGRRAVVGAPTAGDSGRAFAFERRGDRWRRATLPVSAAGHGARVGQAVAVDGSRALVGAPSAGEDSAGAAFVFESRPGGWTEVATLRPPADAGRAAFGWDVALDGTRMLIGARGADTAGTDAGAAHVFERAADGWTHRGSLVQPDGDPYDYFGGSVALSGDRALVGAFVDDTAGPDAGSAAVFERRGEGWDHAATLLPADGDRGDQFGNAVALADGRAVVGAVGDDIGQRTATTNPGGTGAAYVFEPGAGGWTQRAKLTAPGGEPGDAVGVAVAVAGDGVVVGAFGDDRAGTDAGAAYRFAPTDGGWRHRRTLTAPDGPAGAAFGNAVAAGGDRLLVGAVGSDLAAPDAGAAYLF